MGCPPACRLSIGMSEERADPNKIVLGAKIHQGQLFLRVERDCAKSRGAKVHPSFIEIASVNYRE